MRLLHKIALDAALEPHPRDLKRQADRIEHTPRHVVTTREPQEPGGGDEYSTRSYTHDLLVL